MWVSSRPWNLLRLFIWKHSARSLLSICLCPVPGLQPFPQQSLGHKAPSIPATPPLSLPWWEGEGLLSAVEVFQSFSPTSPVCLILLSSVFFFYPQIPSPFNLLEYLLLCVALTLFHFSRIKMFRVFILETVSFMIRCTKKNSNQKPFYIFWFQR